MTEQAPGFYRRRVGDLVVTALNDGYLNLPLAALKGITPGAASELLVARFRAPAPRSAINAYLVQGGGHTVLIDTGCGTNMGPTGGKLPQTLAAAGVSPSEIDLILMTHLHSDHTGGLATAEGAAVFPNAGLVISEIEAAFWLDQKPDAAPEPLRAVMASGQASVAPYTSRLVRGPSSAPGITAVPLPGHTPGHTGYRIGDGADALLIWGDVMHVPDVQSVRPDVGVMFDIDGAQAIAIRTHLLDMAATDRLAIAGMHMHFPGFAHIARSGQGYEIVPEPWFPEV